MSLLLAGWRPDWVPRDPVVFRPQKARYASTASWVTKACEVCRAPYATQVQHQRTCISPDCRRIMKSETRRIRGRRS